MSKERASARPSAEAQVASPPERRKEEVLQRYHDLVDLKYLRGLSEAEEAEMDGLGHEIDSYYDDFYEPILAELRERLKNQAAGS